MRSPLFSTMYHMSKPVCNLFSLDCLFDFYFDLKQDDSPAQDKGLTGDAVADPGGSRGPWSPWPCENKS